MQINKKLLLNPSPTVINCAKTVIETIAYRKTVEQKINAIKKLVLTEINAIDKRTGQPLRDPAKIHRLNGEQYEEFKALLRKKYARYNMGAISKPFSSHYPLWHIEEIEGQAKKALVIALEPATGVSYEKLMQDIHLYEDYINLHLRYLIKFI